MHILALPLLLSCMINTATVPITEIGKTDHENNNNIRVKIGLPPLVEPGTILHLDLEFIGNPSSQQVIVNTAETEDVEDKGMIKRRPHQKSRRIKMKKNIKTKFVGLIVEGYLLCGLNRRVMSCILLTA